MTKKICIVETETIPVGSCYDEKEVKIDQSMWVEVSDEEYRAAIWWTARENSQRWNEKRLYVFMQQPNALENVKVWVEAMHKEKQLADEKAAAAKEVKERKREMKAAKQNKLKEEEERRLFEQLAQKYGTSN